MALRADRTAWIEPLRCLLVADVHLGKAARFRRLGVPVPEGGSDETLQRLSAAVDQVQALRLVVLGDLLQGPGCVTAPVDAAWRAFRERHPALHIDLVRGNHDHRAGDPPVHWGVQCMASAEVGGWTLLHEPPLAEPQAGPQPSAWLAGHVHPSLVLRGRAGDALRLPCFHVRPRGVVLPAFGAFTGSHRVDLQPGETAWAVGPAGLVPGRAARPAAGAREAVVI